ncbi:MAG: UDP-N-acetylmuramate dehydrogenase [Magnetococcales bacterium]|nr:UDP-N-acetylmuramate dehydrogenase [Magnetococcales bacterium]
MTVRVDHFAPPSGYIGTLQEAVSMTRRTTLRMGGPARWLAQPEDEKSLATLMRSLTPGTPGLALGGGSNMLVADEGFDGIMLDLTAKMNDIQKHAAEGGEWLIRVGGGASTRTVSHYSRRNGLSGLEFLAGIPGSVGGALKMNAGAYGSEMQNVLVWAELIDVHGQCHRRPVEALGLGYRKSAIPDGWIVASTLLRLHRDDPERIRRRIREMNQKRRRSQPLRYPSAGSVFKNPPEGPLAWELIDRAGLRGASEGAVQISEQHSNFFINRGGARTRDMLALIDCARERVLAESGVRLELELKVIGSGGVRRDL